MEANHTNMMQYVTFRKEVISNYDSIESFDDLKEFCINYNLSFFEHGEQMGLIMLTIWIDKYRRV